MNAIIINRKLSKKEANTIKTTLTKKNGNVLIRGINFTSCKYIKKFSLTKIEVLAEEKKRINYDVFKKVLNFGEKNINEKKISDLLIYKNFRFWYYFKFRIYFLLRNTTYEAQQILNVLQVYDSVSYYGDNSHLLFFNFPKKTMFYFPRKKHSLKVISFTKYISFFALRVILGYFQNTQANQKKNHIIIDHTIKQPVLDPVTLNTYRDNSTLSYLHKKIGKEFISLINIDFPKFDKKYKSILTFKEHFQKKDILFGDWILFKGMTNSLIRKNIHNVLNKYTQEIEAITAFCQTTEEIIIINVLKSLTASASLFLFKYLSYKKYFEEHNFKSISTIDENSPTNRAILDAARYCNIKTYAIQHGNFNYLHPAYMHSSEDRNRDIFCDKTFVWGKYWKNLLTTKGNYPIKKVQITGQIRTDVINTLLQNQQKVATKLPNELSNKHVLMFASQPQRDPAIRRQSAFDVFTAIKNDVNSILVCKLHPNEKNDFSYYRQIAKDAGCSNYIILYDIDLYLLISYSDIIITCFSTVGSESVYFYKPLIILDPLKQDIQNYHKEGVAFQATNANELAYFINKINTGKLSINKKAYDNFIEKYAYKIDGNAAERTLNFIKQL